MLYPEHKISLKYRGELAISFDSKQISIHTKSQTLGMIDFLNEASRRYNLKFKVYPRDGELFVYSLVHDYTWWIGTPENCEPKPLIIWRTEREDWFPTYPIQRKIHERNNNETPPTNLPRTLG